MDIKNKNELKRRIDLFLHDFTHEEYLKEIPKEKVLPTGQLTLFDLFDMSGG